MGLRDGHTSDSPETPMASAECMARGLDGVQGSGADSQAYCKRTLGGLAQGVGLITEDYHRIVCDAGGIDQAWYRGAATGPNSPSWLTPP